MHVPSGIEHKRKLIHSSLPVAGVVRTGLVTIQLLEVVIEVGVVDVVSSAVDTSSPVDVVVSVGKRLVVGGSVGLGSTAGKVRTFTHLHMFMYNSAKRS